MQTKTTLHTPLHSLHLELEGKMVEFAGYEMPVNYPLGIIKEHLQTRASAGLFDVSHMGQIRVRGDNIAETLESVLPVDLLSLGSHKQKYALLLNESGGVLDDLMAINLGEEFLLVVNAACKHADLAHLDNALGNKLDFELLDNKALIALQGPRAAEALTSVIEASSFNLSTMKFMHVAELRLAGADCLVSRSGYSGEDGFEISVDAEHAEAIASKLLSHEAVIPVGLGARDSLRLEAGLCLYGQDLTPDTTPVEANITWAISPSRRPTGVRAGGFPGASRILEQIDNGCDRKLVGLAPVGRAPMRAGTKLLDQSPMHVGEITSGGFSPSLGKPISMGYVSSTLADTGQELLAEVRGKHLPVVVTPLPFIKHQYYR